MSYRFRELYFGSETHVLVSQFHQEYLSLTPALLRGYVELHPVPALAAAVLLAAHAALGRAAVGVGGAATADQRHLVVTLRN